MISISGPWELCRTCEEASDVLLVDSDFLDVEVSCRMNARLL